MQLHTQELSGFRSGLKRYQVLSSILTFLVGMLLFMGDAIHPSLAMMEAILLSFIVGGIGALISVYQYNTFMLWMAKHRRFLGVNTNALELWNRHFRGNFGAKMNAMISVVVLFAAKGDHGTLWLLLFVVGSGFFSWSIRSAILFLSGSISRRAIY